MAYFLLVIIGFVGGGICIFVVLDRQRKQVAEQQRAQLAQMAWIDQSLKANTEQQAWLQQENSRITAIRAELDARKISLDDLQRENALIKRDLANFDVLRRKLEMDREQQRRSQTELDERCQDVGTRHINDSIKWVTRSINASNFAACKQRLLEVLERCRNIGVRITPQQETEWIGQLRTEFEAAVKAALLREEQAEIKAKIREEQLVERESKRLEQQAEAERIAIQKALDEAMSHSENLHHEEIARLTALLHEAEAKKQRAIAQAQLTKAGHVYVISNIGSFGEGVYKIGMTRRLEPNDRVKELGDASVPFSFDVHMMISCDDAPALEYALHRAFHKQRVNKVNPRKEFYRTDLSAVVEVVKANKGEVEYFAESNAFEYRQSITMSDEDEAYIEGVFEHAGVAVGDDDDELIVGEV